MEGSEKDQVAGLELTESFLLCGRAAMRTHIKNIVIFFHPMSGIQVASGKFSTATGEAEVTRLESEVSLLQVKATMSLKEHIRQVKAEIWDNRRQIAHVRRESLAGADNPYSLMQVFGRGHQITRNGAMVYVTKCQTVEVVPRQHTECTNEIPVTFNDTEVFVDPISLVIKTAAAPVRCNDIAPPRWKLGGKWYCSFPALRDCAEPAQLPVDPVKISDVNVLDLGLGRSIHSKEQMEDFARFQDSQNTRKAYLAEAERSNCQCSGIPVDTTLQADWSYGGDCDPGGVHSGYGQNADRHISESDHHRQNARMGLLDVRSPVGHGIPSGGFSFPVGGGEGQRRCRPDQKSDGG